MRTPATLPVTASAPDGWPYPLTVFECVANVADGRRRAQVDALARACGPPLVDVHVDPDHDRSVFTLVGAELATVEQAVRRLAEATTDVAFDLARNHGVHPRLGVLDVVPFVALDGPSGPAGEAARAFARWWAGTYLVPVFLYDDADPSHRTLPSARRDAFSVRLPDEGPHRPHPRLGATAVGARPPMVAVNCVLDRDDVGIARRIARAVRGRDGGLPGVRALGFRLASRGRAQVSMNLVALEQTGLEEACTAARAAAADAGSAVEAVELVGLLPAAELERCSAAFRSWSGIGAERTLEAATARTAAGR
jgi:glutamate formiminotransferase